jgi:hypothetical protein
VRHRLNDALAGLLDIIPPIQRLDLLQRASMQTSLFINGSQQMNPKGLKQER